MPLGTLRITLPDWQTREVTVQQAALSVGRDADNDVVIDDPSVSRRHARLTFEAGRLVVEDLGSSHGTYLADQRLEPNTPSLVPANVPVRLADVEILYQPPLAYQATQNVNDPAQPQAQAPTQRAGAAQPPAPPVQATLAGPTQPVAPGGTTTANLTIYNRGPVVDEFVVRVSGVPAEWVQLSKDRVPLLPNAHEQVLVTIQPPRRAEALATEHRFTLTVLSREHRTGVNVSGVVKVLPYQGLALTLQPVRSARDFQAVVVNQGNAPVTLSFRGSDDTRSLTYHFAQPALTLEAGQTASVGLSVTPRAAPNIGTRETRALSIFARPTNLPGGEEVSTAGQLILRPAIPIWLIPVVVILLLCGCISSAYAYVSLCPNYFATAPLCPAGAPPVINVFTATPTEVERGSAVVIAWDVSNAQTVELVLPAPETLEASGLRTYTLNDSTTFVLRATSFDVSVEQAISVTVRSTQPVIASFTATPGVITAGQTDSIVLSWTTIGAETVTIEGVPGQDFPPSGSVEVPAPSANTTFTLVAANATGIVRQPVTVVISAAECTVSGVPAPDRLSLRAGPAGGYPVVVQVDNGTRVDPLSRTSAGDWLQVRAAGLEGWVTSNFITCTGIDNLNVYPTVNPATLPTLAPTETVTPVPATPTNTTLPPTATPTVTPTPTPTATPLFASGGLITYRVQTGGRTTIYLQNATGAPIALVFDKDDANVLDYTPNNGGRFAIWVLEGGLQKVFIIDRSGTLVGGPITGGWTEITDGDWSYDGQRLVVEAITAGATNYHFYDASGGALGQPALP